MIGIFVLFYLYKILTNKTFTSPYWQFITISIVSSFLLGYVSWKFGSFNFIMNYESRYKILFFILGDALIINAIMSERFARVAIGRDIIWMIFISLFLFYPLIGNAQDLQDGIEKDFGDESKNGIYLEGQQTRLLSGETRKYTIRRKKKCRCRLQVQKSVGIESCSPSSFY